MEGNSKQVKKEMSARQGLHVRPPTEAPKRQLEIISTKRQRPYTGNRNVRPTMTQIPSRASSSFANSGGPHNRSKSPMIVSTIQKRSTLESDSGKKIKHIRAASSGRNTALWQMTKTTQGDTDTFAVRTITATSTTKSARARSANPARRFKKREIDLNDPMIYEIIKRDGKPKKPTHVDHKATEDHDIFEGLDNSRLLSNSVLAKTTYNEIFGNAQSQTPTPGSISARRELGKKKASVDSLKKKLHYINFSRQNFNLINRQ